MTAMPQMKNALDNRTLANALRMLAIDAVEQAKSGHPGAPMGFYGIAISNTIPLTPAGRIAIASFCRTVIAQCFFTRFCICRAMTFRLTS